MADNGDMLSGIIAALEGEKNTQNDIAKTLADIQQSINQVLRSGSKTSLSNARTKIPFSSTSKFSASMRDGFGLKSAMKGFTDSLEQSLMQELVGERFRQELSGIRENLAKSLGVSIDEIPMGLGRELSKQIVGKFKNSEMGSIISRNFEELKQKSLSGIFDKYRKVQNRNLIAEFKDAPEKVARYESLNKLTKLPATELGKNANGAAGEIIKSISGIGAAPTAENMKNLASMSQSTAKCLMDVGTGSIGAGAALADIAAVAAPAAAAIIVVTTALKAMGPALAGTKGLIKKVEESYDRYNISREKSVKNAQQRLEADIQTMVTTPFRILEESAAKLCDVWDSSIRTINATQGYNKDDLQSLISSYAQRLRSEDLSSVVSAADITTNLTKVLESGLSGTVAEEFAYLATKLNAAVPTQDFFSYADTYASIAANAIRSGQNQSSAIQFANKQLEQFASSVLYANREIAGGFTTGLKDASSIFAKSVQIAQAGHSNNASDIASVLTSVSAITGAIAPDLASAMTDAVYNAATGGNSAELVALRSLAGVGASNTEFIQKLTDSPQQIFETIFTELANKQNMSSSSYMEVAESLSSIFGLSLDAFARIDFNYLAKAIASMSVTSSALDANMKLLQTGETTTSAEQQKMAQINKYMIDEGLSYVLDNAAAREIQKHMWDEQSQRELMDATYSVELQGAALGFLEGIRRTIDNIMTFINPLHAVGKTLDLANTVLESNAQTKDLLRMLELGKVGNGNLESAYQLTTRNTDLKLTPSILELFGYNSKPYEFTYDNVSMVRKISSIALNQADFGEANGPMLSDRKLYQVYDSLSSKLSDGVNSLYKWGSVGKSSQYQLLSANGGIPVSGLSSISLGSTSRTEQSQIAANANLQSMLDTMQSYVDGNKSYAEWMSTASKYGISDFEKAVGSAGLSLESVRGQFDSLQTEIAATAKQERDNKEVSFWSSCVDLLTSTTTWLDKIYGKQSELLDSWVDYYINHTAYNRAYDSSSVQRIQAEESESSRDAVYKLADALTQNNVNLLDPTMQTNALLAEILQVANAIMQQNTSSGGAISLPDTIAGLSLGIVRT